jgi:AcrR family transcriptional regulator
VEAARIRPVPSSLPPSSAEHSGSEGRPANPLKDHFARTRVLEGAARVFAKKGIQAATVEDLLEEGGVSRRTFYRLFTSKYDALDALHDVMTGMLRAERRAAYSVAEPPWKKLERMVDTTIGFARRNGALVRLLHGEAQRPESPLAARRLKFLKDIGDEFAEDLKQLIGIVPDAFVIHGLLVMHEGIVHSMLAQDPLDDATVERAKAAIIRITASTLSGQGAHLPPLPLQNDVTEPQHSQSDANSSPAGTPDDSDSVAR